MAKNLNKHFLKEDIQMASRSMKTYLTSFVTRKVNIKATMNCYCTPPKKG